MNRELAQVREAYNSDPEREWQRLESRAQFRLEYLINTHALRKHLPAPTGSPRILDAGGGPGRYTVALAAQGYRVTLLDLSPALLDLARTRVAEAGDDVRRHVEGIVEGSITDLSQFVDAEFDAVLCLGGPLSHVTDPEMRTRAIHELKRVAKPGAPLFVTGMNRLAAYRSVVQWPGCWSQFFGEVSETGLAYIGPGALAYHFMPEEFVTLLSESGLKVERIYGCNGIGAHLQEENLAALMEDPVRWPRWRDLLLATADNPYVVGVSNHILAVATKQDAI